jgi:fumarylacetoacetase
MGVLQAEPFAFGIASLAGDEQPRVVVSFHDRVFDLLAACQTGAIEADLDPEIFASSSLNRLLEEGPNAWRSAFKAARDLAAEPDLPTGVVVPRLELTMFLPIEVGDYVDGFAGIHHASNMGRLLRPGTEPLFANWWQMPVGYHGRSGTVVVSGTPIRRPSGQVVVDGMPRLGPTQKLDIELEVGVVIGKGNPRGRPIEVSSAMDHIFGLVLLNDWSARDIQAFEAQPLGPFLGKSFATSISAWVVPLEAVRPYLVAGMAASQDPPPADYLQLNAPAIPDITLQILLLTPAMALAGTAPAVVSEVRFAEAMYWSMAQQLAHATINGASTRPGDLFGSGTISGSDPRKSGGSFLELSWGGSHPLELPGGERRTFLEDGDTVLMRGWGGDDEESSGPTGRLDLGEVLGTVEPGPTF